MLCGPSPLGHHQFLILPVNPFPASAAADDDDDEEEEEEPAPTKTRGSKGKSTKSGTSGRKGKSGGAKATGASPKEKGWYVCKRKEESIKIGEELRFGLLYGKCSSHG